uniref:Uncharacterized protein n=1 Tax=Setaria digitata TaxID=48799 RepID=A0A915PH46_9BILA
MDDDMGIDSKPRARRGRRRFTDRLLTLVGNRSGGISDSLDLNVTSNVCVSGRKNDAAKKGPLGNIMRDTRSTSLKDLFNRESGHDLKDTIKRPLTGLFRKQSSRTNSRLEPKSESKTGRDIFALETLASNYENEQLVSRTSEMPCFEEACFFVLHDVTDVRNTNISHMSAAYQLDFIKSRTSLVKLDDIGPFCKYVGIKLKIAEFFADLTPLLQFLCLKEEADDEEVLWTWDYLFASVSTEMREEWDQDEEHDDEGHELTIALLLPLQPPLVAF